MSGHEAKSGETFPIRAGEVKKGSHVLIKNFPCKVIEITTSKTGKHGHAKANITALGIFDGKKRCDICPTSHNMVAPFVTNTTLSLLDINADGYMQLMDDDTGDMREDLKLPEWPEDLAGSIRDAFTNAAESGDEVYVRVCKAMGHEQVVAVESRSA